MDHCSKKFVSNPVQSVSPDPGSINLLLLFKILCEIFLGPFFYLPPTSLKILWNFVVYFVI